jgi:hypothetical protein
MFGLVAGPLLTVDTSVVAKIAGSTLSFAS